jgi:hypothetical protein
LTLYTVDEQNRVSYFWCQWWEQTTTRKIYTCFFLYFKYRNRSAPTRRYSGSGPPAQWRILLWWRVDVWRATFGQLSFEIVVTCIGETERSLFWSQFTRIFYGYWLEAALKYMFMAFVGILDIILQLWWERQDKSLR